MAMMGLFPVVMLVEIGTPACLGGECLSAMMEASPFVTVILPTPLMAAHTTLKHTHMHLLNCYMTAPGREAGREGPECPLLLPTSPEAGG